jgi:hypothetical protein
MAFVLVMSAGAGVALMVLASSGAVFSAFGFLSLVPMAYIVASVFPVARVLLVSFRHGVPWFGVEPEEASKSPSPRNLITIIPSAYSKGRSTLRFSAWCACSAIMPSEPF